MHELIARRQGESSDGLAANGRAGDVVTHRCYVHDR